MGTCLFCKHGVSKMRSSGVVWCVTTCIPFERNVVCLQPVLVRVCALGRELSKVLAYPLVNLQRKLAAARQHELYDAKKKKKKE